MRRHFRLTLQDSHRTGDWSRYVWRLPTGELTLAMPRHIAGQARPRWLREHVAEADASRPGERARVQAIIDAAFVPEPVLRGARGQCHPDNPLIACPPPLPGEDLLHIAEAGLAEVVARHKAAHISEQRAAIRGLGAERLAEMIGTIYEGITERGFELARIAEQYGLSAATMTRFAGTRWAASRSDAIPDLWRNTASIVGSDPDFVEAAQRAGVWRRVEDVCNAHR